MKRDWHSVLIALGGNLGSVVEAMQNGLDRLHAADDCSVVAVSHVYATPPWGIVEQPRFLNACAELVTTVPAHRLLDRLLAAERAQGRVRDQRWGPRTLDIDLIAYADQHIATPRLTVPHPRLFDRAFVLVPLADIAADRIISGRKVGDAARLSNHIGIEHVDAALTIPGLDGTAAQSCG